MSNAIMCNGVPVVRALIFNRSKASTDVAFHVHGRHADGLVNRRAVHLVDGIEGVHAAEDM